MVWISIVSHLTSDAFTDPGSILDPLTAPLPRLAETARDTSGLDRGIHDEPIRSASRMDTDVSKIVVPPIHFNWVFHYFHHPFWGTPIVGNTHTVDISSVQDPTFHYNLVG